MNKLEQDFLALKQENDTLKEQLEEKQSLLKKVIFLVINDVQEIVESQTIIDKDHAKRVVKMKKIEAISEYSGVDMSNAKEFVEFCRSFSMEFMRAEFKEMGIDLGGLGE